MITSTVMVTTLMPPSYESLPHANPKPLEPGIFYHTPTPTSFPLISSPQQPLALAHPDSLHPTPIPTTSIPMSPTPEQSLPRVPD